MNFLQQRFAQLRSQYHVGLSFVFFMAVTSLVMSIFDSMVSYLVPIVFTNSGLSEIHMGWLYASSSFFGLIFDFILARFLTTTRYSSTFFYAILIAGLVPITLLGWTVPGLYLLGMATWGLYYNLWGFATADFSARESKLPFHVASVSLLLLMHDVGYLVGTLSVEPLLSLLTSSQFLWLLLGIIGLAALLFVPLTKARADKEPRIRTLKKSNLAEISLLLRVSRRIWPLLLFGILMSAVDAVTWTITPILDTVFPEIGKFGGVVLAINFLPSFFAYGIATWLTSRWGGKKRLGMWSFVCGALTLAVLGVSTSLTMYLVISFLSAFFFSISYASLGGTYADYLRESTLLDSEIMATRDMATNIGYIIGPIIGGTLLTSIGSISLYTYLGVTVAVIVVVLYFLTPKSIPFAKV